MLGFAYAFLLHFLAWVTFFYCFRWIWKQVGISVLIVLSASLALVTNSLQTVSVADYSHSTLLILGVWQVTKALSVGVPLALALECFPFAGRLSDISRGTQFAEQALGPIASRSSLLEGFCEMLVLTLIFPLGGFEAVCGDLIKLFVFESPVKMNSPEFAIRVSSESLQYGLFLAIPVVISSLCLDFCILSLSRHLPRVNISFECMGLRACLGLILFSLLFAAPPEYLRDFFVLVVEVTLREGAG
jgi:flagellar biosynthesis protein FliR